MTSSCVLMDNLLKGSTFSDSLLTILVDNKELLHSCLGMGLVLKDYVDCPLTNRSI